MKQSRVLVVSGVESSGKSTLATQLCNALQAPLIQEHAREYLTQQHTINSHFRYQQTDLLNIAKQQHAQEVSQLASHPEFIICDTDLLVIIIWSEVKYGICDPWIIQTFEKAINDSPPRHYLLCDWNIPWQADELRENPHDREILFERHLQKLEEYKLSYTHINGSPQQRLQQALRLQQA